MQSPKSIKPKSTIHFKSNVSRFKTNKKARSKNFLSLPKNIISKFPLQTKIMVEGIINSFPFRTTLTSDNRRGHCLHISKAMYDAVGIGQKNVVTVEITRVGKEAETRLPLDLRKALIATPRAQALWMEISPVARRDWIYWIISAKKPETRRRRITITCDKLICGKGRVCCFGGIEWLKKQPKVSNLR